MLKSHTFLPQTIVIIACLITFEIFLYFLPEHLSNWALQENGPIENGSVAGYLLGALWLCVHGYKKKSVNSYTSAVLLLCLAFRELDFHTRFTTMGIFKTRFYISSEVPMQEKVIVSIVVALLLLSVTWYCIRNSKPFIASLRGRATWALSITIAVSLAVLSKTFDRCNEEIDYFTTKFLGLSTEKILRISEETFELAIPVFLLLAIAHYTLDQSRHPE